MRPSNSPDNLKKVVLDIPNDFEFRYEAPNDSTVRIFRAEDSALTGIFANEQYNDEQKKRINEGYVAAINALSNKGWKPGLFNSGLKDGEYALKAGPTRDIIGENQLIAAGSSIYLHTHRNDNTMPHLEKEKEIAGPFSKYYEEGVQRAHHLMLCLIANNNNGLSENHEFVGKTFTTHWGKN